MLESLIWVYLFGGVIATIVVAIAEAQRVYMDQREEGAILKEMLVKVFFWPFYIKIRLRKTSMGSMRLAAYSFILHCKKAFKETGVQ